MSYSIAKVNLGAIKNNLQNVKNFLGKTKICGVVKSNAYGHGLVETAKAINYLVDYYAVSFLEEGIKLRFAGITKPILILIPVDEKEIEVCSRYNLTITIISIKQTQKIIKKNCKITAHIAVNSGMNRIGINRIEELKTILNLTKNSLIEIMGIFSHFRENNKKACYVQYKRYEKFSLIAKKYNSKIISHICSSASAILFPEYRQDMVRIGILMYGYNPTNNTQIKVKPALKIYAKKIQDRNLKKGQNLLYGNYNLQNNKKISIIKYGYADGATRSSGTYNNRCMDLSATKRCKAYKIVLNNADILAKMHNTIAYEILVSYTIRCNYIYYENYCRKT